jgi:hypothetical protein
MIFVQPRIMPDETAQMLDQAKMGDHIAGYNETVQFGGMPETVVPKALPADNKPNALLPPPAVVGEPKKSFFGRMKGLFQKSKPEDLRQSGRESRQIQPAPPVTR